MSDGERRLEEEVERKLSLAFPSEADRGRARAALASYGTASHEREVERVRLAVVELCQGSLAELSTLTAAAKTDYRDVLAWAEFPVKGG